MAEKKKSGQKKRTDPFIDSFKSIASLRFWKVFAFDLLTILSFVILFSIFGMNVQKMMPELSDMTPIAEDTYNLMSNQDIVQGSEEFSEVEKNVKDMKKMTYAFVFKLIRFALAFIISFLVLYSVLQAFSWIFLLNLKIRLVYFWKSIVLNLVWLVALSVLIGITAWLFKPPLNAVIIAIELLCFLYFGIVADLIFFRKNDLKAALAKCFRLGTRKHTLIWLLVCAAMLVFLFIISKLLLSLSFAFSTLLFILFILYIPWSKILLLSMLKDVK